MHTNNIKSMMFDKLEKIQHFWKVREILKHKGRFKSNVDQFEEPNVTYDEVLDQNINKIFKLKLKIQVADDVKGDDQVYIKVQSCDMIEVKNIPITDFLIPVWFLDPQKNNLLPFLEMIIKEIAEKFKEQ